MNLDTDYFRLLAQHSESALVLMAQSLAEQRNFEALRQLLPVFLDDMKGGIFHQSDVRLMAHSIGASNNRELSVHSIVGALEVALRPPPASTHSTWTGEQAEIFDAMLPFLLNHSVHAGNFLNIAVQNGRDPAVLQLIQPDSEEKHQLLTSAAKACNPFMLTALIEQTPLPVIEAWLETIQHQRASMATQEVTSALQASWENAATRPILSRLLEAVDRDLGLAVRMEMFAQSVSCHNSLGDDEIPFGDEEPEHEEIGPPPEPLKPGQFAALLGVSSLTRALGIVHDCATAYAQKTPLAEFKKSLPITNYSNPVMIVTAFALYSHCAPLLKALTPVFASYTHDVDVYSHVMASELEDPQNFKATVAFLQTMGYPLQYGCGTSKQHDPACALSRLAYHTAQPTWEAKLAILLDLGADPHAKDDRGKEPVDHVLVKANRKAWKNVVLSHNARRCAMSAIDDIDFETSHKPAP